MPQIGHVPFLHTLQWVALTLSERMQKKLLLVSRCSLCLNIFSITFNDFDAKKSIHYSQLIVVTEFVASRTKV